MKTAYWVTPGANEETNQPAGDDDDDDTHTHTHKEDDTNTSAWSDAQAN